MAQPSITEVRPSQSGDGPVVAACVYAAYTPFVEAIGRTPAPLLDDYERLIAEDSVWVAEVGGQLVGVIVMWGKRDHWYVDNIAVDPRHQGSGIGSVLLVEAERQARLAGHSEIRLYTNEAMTSNQNYYPKRGYIETHRALDRGFRRIFYTRSLSAE